MVFPPPPPPKKPLGQYRLLAPNASIWVSPLCLGTMNFGKAWVDFMGECDQKTANEILDYYYEQGGNFLDTANNYQDEESEKWIGEWMAKKQNRDQMVIATKFTTAFRAGRGEKEILINTGGNGTKSLHVSLEASLKKLQTSYVDILYVHWYDWTCSVAEMMQALNVMINQGKVLYLGVSDTPAWVVSKCNEYARQNGLRQFSVYQGRWSAEYRDFERDIIQMCAAEGMGMAPWGTLGGGAFKSEEQRKSQEKGRNAGPPSEAAVNISKVLEKLGNKHKAQITSIALAYVMHKAPYVFPIVGGRKIDHLKGNIDGLGVALSDEDIEEIDGANAFDIGFPQNFLGGPKGVRTNNDLWLMNFAGHRQDVAKPKAIGPTGPDFKA
ncbi:IN2-2 protein [Venustampulla echinocandica]|uniref:IN2-2 protein n=1 Tax=Venustampulla echinocandica TaxID=2656787 RepID=A0A370TWU4_9HELO|nr:IN2-2 protein [Venustampulla echinocandica]RDL39948.1 IN2-2 protein [Venustampulla echinocandica]